MKRRTTTRQQILAALAAMAPPDLTPEQEAAARRIAEAAERRIHEKAIAKEIAERRKLINLIFRGADNALSRKRDEDLSARARTTPPHDPHGNPPDSGPRDGGSRYEFSAGAAGAGWPPSWLRFEARGANTVYSMR